MKPQDQLSLSQLNKLFSIVIVIDRDLRIVFSSDTLQRHMPVVVQTPHLNEIFNIKRPQAIDRFEDARALLDSLFLMEAKDLSFAVRGQMQSTTDDQGAEHLCFFGSPWLSWVISNNPELKLGIKDFSPQDVQLDQLFYISTEKRMVEDLERLNEQLHSAKDEAESAHAAKNAFFAQMSHEMRTPLNSVVSALTLIKDQDLPQNTSELVELARQSSRNLMQVINYVLDLSKIESDDDREEAIAFDLPELVASVINIVHARAIEKGLRLESLIDSSLASTYKGDLHRLRQTLLNLVINAIKFTERGSITLDVRPPEAADQQLRIEVIDTGIGIGKQDQKHIFEPFRTLNKGGVIGSDSGTGLGLDIARRNVELMGGKIGVSSAPGVGSTFWVELPCQPDANPASADLAGTVDSSVGAPQTDGENPFTGHVLLVEDNETNLMLGTMILESMGISVTPATSGEEAVEIARNTALDLVLMDISMPGIDGFEATRRIREFADAGTLPIVALTAFTSSLERRKSEECGMNDYLTKPMEQEKLKETLAAWLPRSQSSQSATRGTDSADAAAGQVDQAVLNQLKQQIGVDNVVKVIAKFCDEADKRWNALETATSDHDRAREAHTLASTCRSFGLPAVADKLNCIEDHAKADTLSQEPPCIAETGRQLVRDLAALRTAVEGL